MTKIVEILEKLVPLWLALLAVAFGYLVILFRRASKEFINISQKQADYLKDRVDVVDKTTEIFERTIERQEKELKTLRERLRGWGQHVESARAADSRQAASELEHLSKTLRRILETQDKLIQEVADLKRDKGEVSDLADTQLRVAQLFEELSQIKESRELSLYTVSVTPFADAEEFVALLKASGYSADIYEPVLEREPRGSQPEEHKTIWLGKNVPLEFAREVVKIAKQHYPHLKYISTPGELRDDPPEYVHNQIYIGGATSTALQDGLKPWEESDFDDLLKAPTKEALHKKVRAKYR